jgi:hypothetical protein
LYKINEIGILAISPIFCFQRIADSLGLVFNCSLND